MSFPNYGIEPDRLEFDTDVSINDIRKYFIKNNRGVGFSMFETGLDDYRFDLIKVNPHRQHVRIFEFKSGRHDFISDKKWQNYLKYCHTFTFVSPREAILKDDIPKGIGLLWVFKWKYKHRDKWNPTGDNWSLSGEWIRRPKGRDVDKTILIKLAFMMVSRIRWRKEDVF